MLVLSLIAETIAHWKRSQEWARRTAEVLVAELGVNRNDTRGYLEGRGLNRGPA